MKEIERFCFFIAFRIEDELKELKKAARSLIKKSPTKPTGPRPTTRSQTQNLNSLAPLVDEDAPSKQPEEVPDSPKKRTIKALPRRTPQKFASTLTDEQVLMAKSASPKGKEHPSTLPRTPSRASRSNHPSRQSQTLPIFRKVAEQISEEEPPRRTRYRPPFLEHQQWSQHDPRVDREWSQAQSRVESWAIVLEPS